MSNVAANNIIYYFPWANQFHLTSVRGCWFRGSVPDFHYVCGIILFWYISILYRFISIFGKTTQLFCSLFISCKKQITSSPKWESFRTSTVSFFNSKLCFPQISQVYEISTKITNLHRVILTIILNMHIFNFVQYLFLHGTKKQY